MKSIPDFCYIYQAFCIEEQEKL